MLERTLDRMQIFKTLDIEIKKQRGAPSVKHPYKDHKSLKDVLAKRGLSVVAEIAGGNPLVGKARSSFRPATHAKALLESGAAALSVATDSYCYSGQDKHLHEVRGVAPCPLIRRDFIFEEFQVEESKALGADAIILVAPLLQPERLRDLHAMAVKRRLDVIVEVFDQEDVESALEAGAQIICAVGRDIDTWEVSWESALRLLKKIPSKKCLKMVEAGVSRLQQLKELESLGVHGVIIGDVLLPEFYPGKRLAQLLGGQEPPARPQKQPQKSQKAQPPKKGAGPEPKPAAKPDAKPVAKPAANVQARPAANAQARPAAKPAAKPRPKPVAKVQAKAPAPAKRPAAGAKVAKVTQSAKAQAAAKPAAPGKTAKAQAKARTTITGKPTATPAQRPDKGIKETSMAITKNAEKAATVETEKKVAAPKKAAAKKPVAKAAKTAPKKATAAKKPVAKATVKKTAPKAAAKPTAKKAAPKKAAAAKKPVVKSAAAKPAAKPAAKKAAPKAAVKKAAPKKATTAKKPVAKKAAPKKAAAAKTAKAAKPTVKKAAASKTMVKKAVAPKMAKKAAPARKPCAPKKPAAH